MSIKWNKFILTWIWHKNCIKLNKHFYTQISGWNWSEFANNILCQNKFAFKKFFWESIHKTKVLPFVHLVHSSLRKSEMLSMPDIKLHLIFLLDSLQQKSLCSEMGDELNFALQCNSTRPKAPSSSSYGRRQCSKCLNSAEFVPSSLAVPHKNGVMSGLDFRKSPNIHNMDYDSSWA